VPGYLEHQEALKEAGVEEVLVYCVNDSAVMKAWGETYGLSGSMVRFLADPAGDLTRALGMAMTHPGPPSVGIIGRCKRFAIHAVDGKVRTVKVSERPDDPAGDDDPSATLAPGFLAAIRAEPGFVPKAGGAGPPAAANDAGPFVKGEVAAHDVVIFSKTFCPYCKKTKALFSDELKVTASVIELDKRDDGAAIQAALLELTGQRTVPSVWIKGKHIGGADDTAAAHGSGKIKDMLGL
jgi:glutaredoxin 3